MSPRPRCRSHRSRRRPSRTCPRSREEIELALKACARRLKTHLNKAERKGKTRVKFEIVHEIIPMIAQKSAKIVDRPVPDIRGTITKIMNVVWMEDSVAYEKKRHHVSVKMYNYTPKSQSFHLHMLVPHENIDKKTLELEPIEVREGNKLTWDIKRVASTEMYELKFDLVGLPQEEYDENEIYVSGIDAASVIGVDVLPGRLGPGAPQDRRGGRARSRRRGGRGRGDRLRRGRGGDQP